MSQEDFPIHPVRRRVAEPGNRAGKQLPDRHGAGPPGMEISTRTIFFTLALATEKPHLTTRDYRSGWPDSHRAKGMYNKTLYSPPAGARHSPPTRR
jgi:hypothetical protein